MALMLAIETTGAKASVALANDEEYIGQIQSESEMNHLVGLIPMIDKLLATNGKTLDDVDVIACSEGPGSFTGIRIVISTARVIAQAKGLPLIGVPTLNAFAYNIPDFEGIACPVFDARRDLGKKCMKYSFTRKNST